MNADASAGAEGLTPVPAIASQVEFEQAVAWCLRTSISRGARRITWIDRDFSEWPLDDPQLHGELAAWLRLPQRRLVLLAAGFAGVARLHPRFVRWRTTWAHALETLVLPEGEAVDLPAVIYDDGRVSMQLLDRLHWRGRCSLTPTDAWALREEFEPILQRSSPGFPVNALGL